MPQRRLLLLDANRLSAYCWQSGRLSEERSFAADTAGTEAYAQYLADHAGSIFAVLADVAEEGFQIEDVPSVVGKDRAALTRRRLGQYFYGTPFALAASLGREKTGRRDEKILFAALTQPRHLEPWLDAMQAAHIRLAGVYSAPQTLGTLLSARQSSGPRLVLSISRAGVRQTFFSDGKLYFSRLTALATGTMEEAAVACAVEAQKIYQYLAGQRLINRNATLKVSVLAHPEQSGILRAHCRSSAELAFDYIDLLAEAEKSKLKTPPPDSCCDWLLLHQLVLRPPREQFAPDEKRHFYRLWQLRSALAATGVIAFCACLLYSGKQYFDRQSLLEEVRVLEEDTRGDERKYEAALKSLPPLAMGNEDMRELVSRFEDLVKRSPLPETAFIPLSRALDANPGVELQRISWQLTSKLPPAPEQVSGIFKQPPLRVSGSYYAVADIDSRLPANLRNDHRAMLQLINRFVAELGKEKSLGVQVTQLPFDAESGKTIKSTDEAAPGREEAPKFAFRLVQAF